MMQYVALLRGINVGGRNIKMADLRAAFASWGYRNVRSVLASGNVVFESESKDEETIAETIASGIKESFGYEVHILLRTAQDILDLVGQEPFKDIEVTKDTRLYVTFLSVETDHSLEIPYTSPAGNYEILQVSRGRIISVLTLQPGRGTTNAMEILEKEFGAGITTRNWNTILKLRDLIAGA